MNTEEGCGQGRGGLPNDETYSGRERHEVRLIVIEESR